MEETMADSELTFEAKMQQLEEIVRQLEQGNTPLEAAMDQFKKGITLTNELQQTLSQAEETMTKMIDQNGNETNFEAPPNESDNGNE